MARFPIITVGTAGVDMRKNPLLLGNERLAAATNIAFDEATIRTRPGFNIHLLDAYGPFQGAAYVVPSAGLSAVSYSKHPASLAIVSDGALTIHAAKGYGEFHDAFRVSCPVLKGPVHVFDAECYVIVVGEKNKTLWWDGSTSTATVSPGIQPPSDENTHDDFEITNFLPNYSTTGHYIHGRNHISKAFSIRGNSIELNSELWVSDLLTKRGPDQHDDILSMEEALLDSTGGPLVAPSRLGKTVVMETLLMGSVNGEGMLVDFREHGVVTHDTLSAPRETLAAATGDGIIQAGWDEKRITTVQLQSVSAVGPYAVAQLPDDIWFRSQYGFHFLKSVFGQGTYKDEHLNHISHDIQPLIDMDDGFDLEGLAAGFWMKGNRWLGTVGVVSDLSISTRPYAMGIVSCNQATTLTEDNTPRNQWEGLWLPPSDVLGIHRFCKGSLDRFDNTYGFIGSLENSQLVYGSFDTKHPGLDVIDGTNRRIPWSITTGAFLLTGARNVDGLRSGILDFIGNESTRFVRVMVRTDENQCWKEWIKIEPELSGEFLVSRSFGEPPKGYREATWFQFRFEGEGYVDLRFFDVEAVKVVEKDDGRNHTVPVCSEPVDYLK